MAETTANMTAPPSTPTEACELYMTYLPTSVPWGAMPLPVLRGVIRACEPAAKLSAVQAATFGSMQMDTLFSTYHDFIRDSSRGAGISNPGKQAMRYSATQLAIDKASGAYASAANDPRPVHAAMAGIMGGSMPLYQHLIQGGELTSREPYNRWRTNFKLVLENLLDQADTFDHVEEMPTLRVIGLLGVMNAANSEEAFLPLPNRYSQSPDPYFRLHALRWHFGRKSYLPTRIANSMLPGYVSIQPSILENSASPAGGTIGTLHAVFDHMRTETRQAKQAAKARGRTSRPKPPTKSSKHVQAVRENIVSGIDNFLTQARQEYESPTPLSEIPQSTGLEQYRKLTAAEEILLIPDPQLEDAIAELSSRDNPSLAERRERAELLMEYGYKLLARDDKTGMDYIASSGQEFQELRRVSAAGTLSYYEAWAAYAASFMQAELHNDDISADDLEEQHLPNYHEQLIAAAEHALARRSKHITYEEYAEANELDGVLHKLTALLMLNNVERGTIAHLSPTRCTRGPAGWDISVVVRQPQGYQSYYFGRLRLGSTAKVDSLEENVLSIAYDNIEPRADGRTRFKTLKTELARLRDEYIDEATLEEHEAIRDQLMQATFTAEY